MATLSVTVPESATVTAADVIAGAARRAGHTAQHEAAPEAFLAVYLAEHLLTLYRSAKVDEAVAQVAAAVPAPTKPRLRTATVDDSQATTATPERTK